MRDFKVDELLIDASSLVLEISSPRGFAERRRRRKRQTADDQRQTTNGRRLKRSSLLEVLAAMQTTGNASRK